MFFELTEEHLAVQAAAREFAQKELKAGVIERDSKMEYPREQVRQMGELGFLGMMVPPEYGGGGMDTLSYVLAMEEISKIDNSCSVIMSVNNSLVCWGIEAYGSEEQKSKYLPKLATGEMDRRVLPQRTGGRQRCHEPTHYRRGHGRSLLGQRHQKLDHQRRQLQAAHRNSPNRPGKRPPRHQCPFGGNRLARRGHRR
jgi:alkylation response protein AidB-like acyl-CoA dehydrogenase